jgi:rhamnogalacturonan endolyase
VFAAEPFQFQFNLILLAVWLASSLAAFGNLPGGGTGTGPDVTLLDNGNGTVTMANGIVSILCTKNSATITQINYTYNNSGTTVTRQLLAGGTDGGQLYWETGGFGSGVFNYSVVANNGDYCEIDLASESTTNGVMDIHFSMLRGSPGFYVAVIWSHRSADVAMTMGETRDNIYAGSIFNWMSVDATRNRLMEVQPGSAATGVFGAPVEVSLWTNGIYQGHYEDKYKYSADMGVQRVWGWGSVGAGGSNVGLWNVSASGEYYTGGPMKRDLMEHIGTTILNMLQSGHYGGGTDASWSGGEVWSKVCGPYFIYCNNVTNTITGTNQAAQLLYQDAQAQAAAEQTAWPYVWFTNANYAAASQRGTVTGQLAINDAYNPNASAANLWVGLVQQPATTDGIYDFQEWMKACQFWVRTDTNGNFAVSNVIAGANYTLYAFGPGAAGTFQSQALSGGSAPNTVDIPAAPFGVTVTAGETNDLGTITWTPTRIGPTVFEIGYPDRTARKFRHGEDWWVGDIGPSPTNPMPVWSKFLEYPFDFPSGPNYTVGQSRWTTDWNFIQPIDTDLSGNYNGSTSTITFDLAQAPAGGSEASLYVALASDYQGAMVVQVNGNDLAGSAGYFPAYSSSGNESDASIREGIHGMFSDNRLNFSGSLLQAGRNTITLNMRKGGYFANHAMYDYVRLELTGYVPPAPADIAAYPGNNCNLIAWPVVPGATSYNVLRSTLSGGGYTTVTNGVTGPVCGSGWNNATCLDTTAVNGTTYYYVVQSVNPAGTSADSPETAGATPSASLPANAPAAPTGLAVGSVAHQRVTLNWSASAGANYYTIQRSTLFDNGGGTSNVLGTIVLANNVTGTSYIDASPTDGSIYGYTVSAAGAGGCSSNSGLVAAVPLPSPPSGPPGNAVVNGGPGQTNYFVHWSPVAGAVGYVVRRSTSASGPWSFVMSITETNWTDYGSSASAQYFYTITAVNAAGAASGSIIAGPPGIPATLGATAGNTEVLLSWAASPGATSYTVVRGTSSGNETTTVATGITANNYLDTGLTNGTTYYYIVQAVGSAVTSGNSPEASAMPSSVGISGLVWTGAAGTAWDTTTTNWVDGLVATTYVDGDLVTFNDSAASGNVVITGAVSPDYVLFANSNLNYVVSATGAGISGTTSLIKSNTGSLTLSSANVYSGGTSLNGGTLILNNATAAGTNAITLNGGTLVLGAIIANPINVAGTATISPGSVDYNDSPLSGGGRLNVNITGANTFSPGADMSAFTGTNELGTSSGSYRFYGSLGSAAATFDLGIGTVTLLNRNGGVTIQLGALLGNASTTVSGASALNAPTTYSVGGNNNDATFSGRIVNGLGTTAIVKTGNGTWTLAGTNTYSGGTTINGGTLLVKNAGGSATGSGSVTVNAGGTLAGHGMIAGAVIVSSGGLLAPGGAPGGLTLSNNLTLAPGSTTFLQVQASPLTNDVLEIGGTLIEGGTLMVTNVGGTLASGDSFRLFNAGAYAGAFANFILPALSGNLVWNTNALALSGTLSVAAYAPPVIGSISLAGGNLVASGSGGIPFWTYYVLASTNLTAAQWTPVATNQFDTAGNFVFTNAIGGSARQSFYRLQLQ